MFRQTVFDPEADFDEEITHPQEQEDTSSRKGLKNGSIYDDDEFEMNAEWNSDSIYNDILGARNRRRACQVSDKPSVVSLLSAAAEVEEEQVGTTAALNLPKGGWQVKKIDVEVESSDFPTLVHSASLTKEKPTQKAFSNVAKETKWKNITKDFFKDDEEDAPNEEEKFTQVRQKSAGPRSAGKSYPRAQGHPSTQRSLLRKPYQQGGQQPGGHSTGQQGGASGGANGQGPRQRSFHPQGQGQGHGQASADTQPFPKPQEGDEAGKKPNEEFKNTRMCSFLDKCKRKDCTFAHTLDEYNPVECRFQLKCKSVDVNGNYTCRFKHKDETKEAYLSRSSTQKKA